MDGKQDQAAAEIKVFDSLAEHGQELTPALNMVGKVGNVVDLDHAGKSALQLGAVVEMLGIHYTVQRFNAGNLVLRPVVPQKIAGRNYANVRDIMEALRNA